MIVVHHQSHPGCLGRCDDTPCVFELRGHRLFEEHMQTGVRTNGALRRRERVRQPTMTASGPSAISASRSSTTGTPVFSARRARTSGARSATPTTSTRSTSSAALRCRIPALPIRAQRFSTSLEPRAKQVSASKAEIVPKGVAENTDDDAGRHEARPVHRHRKRERRARTADGGLAGHGERTDVEVQEPSNPEQNDRVA